MRTFIGVTIIDCLMSQIGSLSKIKNIALFWLVVASTTSPAAPEYELSRFNRALKFAESDLNSLAELKFKNVSPWHQKIFGNDHLSEFILSHVHGFAWIQDKGSGFTAHGTPYSPSPDAPLPAQWQYYLPLDTPSGGTIILSENYIDNSKKVPKVVRTAVLVHEARHTEKDSLGWNHVLCPLHYVFTVNGEGFDLSRLDKATLIGAPACDDSELGAYAVGYTFFQSVAESCTNCNEKMKMDARLYGPSEGISRIVTEESATKLLLQANRNPRSAMEDIRNSFKQVSQPAR